MFFFSNIFRTFVRMKQAMIFAAGLGTRLKPLTDTMPKALVPVTGKPLLWHVVMKLKAAGFERVVVNVHHFASQIVDYIHQNEGFGIDMRISDETEKLLETGGGIKKALPLFDSDSSVLIHNVDILSNVDLAAFYAHAASHEATLLVSERQTSRYLQFDDDMRLIGWKNTATGEVKGREGKSLAFSGIHVVSPKLAACFHQMPERFSIIDFYLRWCQEHSFVGFCQKDLRLIDVGKLDTLRMADNVLLQQQI